MANKVQNEIKPTQVLVFFLTCVIIMFVLGLILDQYSSNEESKGPPMDQLNDQYVN